MTGQGKEIKEYTDKDILEEAHARILRMTQEQVKKDWEDRLGLGAKNTSENRKEFWMKTLPTKYGRLVDKYFNLGCFGERAGEIPNEKHWDNIKKKDEGK